MISAFNPKRYYPGLIPAITILLLTKLGSTMSIAWADELPYALNIYAGRLTSNHWEEFFHNTDELDFKRSYLAAIALARRIGTYRDKASFEVEGQVVKHFDIQTHWELNALVTVRWEAFWWDDVLDTSLAFGLGPSYATKKPEIEIENNEETSRFLVYWMLELAVALPKYSHIAWITRIHHRSDAFGLIGDGGGSNALAMGLKWRF
ncbi:MAG: hypothetical protein OER74_09545 [Desulfobacteraceae bacterium]|nr:hypothetical protein [Desulfobacteraceae bacterium]